MIVYVGELHHGSTSRMRAETFSDLGIPTSLINTAEIVAKYSRTGLVLKATQRYVPLWTRGSRQIVREIADRVTQLRPKVLWVDKGVLVSPRILQWAKRQFGVVSVHYNPDDPFGSLRHGWSGFLKCLPYYDVHFVPRDDNVAEYKRLGASAVYTFDRGFDPRVHRPMILSEADRRKYSAAIGLVASYAAKRAGSIAHLIKSGIELSVRGSDWSRAADWDVIQPRWRGEGVFGDEYAKAICGLDIALHFVRHENRDQQDSRTFEIPACGAFMLAERTPKHLEFFEDGKEAVFFGCDDELKEKAVYYSSHADERKRIAEAGHARCYRSGYSYAQRLKGLLAKVADATGVKVL